MKNNYLVIGYPLGHTMSPFIHNLLFSVSKMPAEYFSKEINPTELESSKKELCSYRGFNVTIPHKEKIIPLLDSLHFSAKLYGAVNTVSQNNGKLTGYNTDADGFLGALALKKIEPKGKVLICGNGGVARTIAIALAEKGCSVTLGVRNKESEKVPAIKNEIHSLFGADIRVLHLSEIDEPFDIAVNGTPLGMYPNFNGAPLEKRQLTGTKFVFDTVYNPAETLFLKYAGELDIPCMGGMAMLVMQAAKAHEYWYGHKFKAEEILAVTEKAQKEMERIFYGR